MSGADKPPTTHINCAQPHIVMQTEVGHLQENGPYACIYILRGEEWQEAGWVQGLCMERSRCAGSPHTQGTRGGWVGPSESRFFTPFVLFSTALFHLPHIYCSVSRGLLQVWVHPSVVIQMSTHSAKVCCIAELKLWVIWGKGKCKPLWCWTYQCFHTSQKNWKCCGKWARS